MNKFVEQLADRDMRIIQIMSMMPELQDVHVQWDMVSSPRLDVIRMMLTAGATIDEVRAVLNSYDIR